MTDPHPTEGELAILRVLWAMDGPATVRDVHDELLRGKDTAYTTVLKMLSIMTDKKLVRRDESERSHRFVPLYTEPAVQSSMLKSFLHNTFSGSAVKLVQSALADDRTSAEELEAIGKLIAQAKSRRRK
ncbi:MAG: BlaI/MecI/CopY family transcriptional regulator [Burkholderiaceae bacterium]|jgi:BlaI family penicillinase repressor